MTLQIDFHSESQFTESYGLQRLQIKGAGRASDTKCHWKSDSVCLSVCVYVEEAVNAVPENSCDPLSRGSDLKCVQCLDTCCYSVNHCSS